MKSKKSPFMRWIDGQLQRDPQLRQRVEQALNEMRIEQDLAALREGQGVSQGQLARMVGVSQPAIAKIESGRVKNLQLKTLIRNAAALGGKVRIEIVKEGRPGKTLPLRTRRSA